MLSVNRKNRSYTTLRDLKNWYKAKIVEKYSINRTLLIELSWIKLRAIELINIYKFAEN